MAVTLEDPRIVWTLEKLPGWKVSRAAEFPQFGTCSVLRYHAEYNQLGVLLPGMILITYNPTTMPYSLKGKKVLVTAGSR